MKELKEIIKSEDISKLCIWLEQHETRYYIFKSFCYSIKNLNNKCFKYLWSRHYQDELLYLIKKDYYLLSLTDKTIKYKNYEAFHFIESLDTDFYNKYLQLIIKSTIRYNNYEMFEYLITHYKINESVYKYLYIYRIITDNIKHFYEITLNYFPNVDYLPAYYQMIDLKIIDIPEFDYDIHNYLKSICLLMKKYKYE